MLKIDRWYMDDCTVGRASVEGFNFWTLELPDLNNRRNVSCIPEGTYQCFKRNSPKNGNVFELKDVQNRTYIQIHSGNYTSQIEGCILVGDSVKFLNADGIPDITNSKNTLSKLMELLQDEFIVSVGS